MGHLKQLDVELRERIAEDDTETLVKWVKDQVLQSYKNGLAARKHSGDKSQESGKQDREQ
jgi:hypothetical protein